MHMHTGRGLDKVAETIKALGVNTIQIFTGNPSAWRSAAVDPNATEPMYVENTGHPVSSRLALAHASKSHVHALGLEWDDVSGRNNGHYAAFSWRSA